MEFTVENAASIEGFHQDIFALAEKRTALTCDTSNCIRMDKGVLRIKVHFSNEESVGLFVFDVRERCRFCEATVGPVHRYSHILSEMDVPISVDHYKHDPDAGPPNTRPRSKDDETDVTQVSAESELAAFQALERLTPYSKMDSAHLKPSCECESSAENKDKSNRIAVTPSLHRALDGTYSKKTKKWKPWVRLSVMSVDTENLYVYKDKFDKSHTRYRVVLKIDFKSKDHYRVAVYDFNWKTDTVFYEEGAYLITYVHVKDHVTFQNGVNRKYEITSNLWNAGSDVEDEESEDEMESD